MKKLPRHEANKAYMDAGPHCGETVSVCYADDVAALEAENDKRKVAEWEAKEKALRELADRWMDEMKPTTTPVIHQSFICNEHALYLRAILNTPAAGGKEQP